MNLKNLLFSPKGRIGRERFILANLMSFISIAFPFAVMFSGLPCTISETIESISDTLSLVILYIGITVYLVIYFMLGIKRYHDLNKSGWWVFVGFIPYIGLLWYFIETCFFKGTEGENRFGADPLAK